MAEAYNFFSGTQEDINRRLLRKIEALENASPSEPYDDTEIKSRIKAVEDEIGADDEADTVKGRIKALEDAE